MENEGIRQLIAEKVSEKDIVITWSADLRYDGQSWELNTPIRRARTLTKEDLRKMAKDFNQLHQQVYSYSEPNEVVEFVILRVQIIGKNPTLALPREEVSTSLVSAKWDHVRDVFFENTGWQKVPIHLRKNLPAGQKIVGPCIVEEPISTTLIPPDFNAFIDEFKNIIIESEDGHEE
jgi:N-methylhydantoinase A